MEGGVRVSGGWDRDGLGDPIWLYVYVSAVHEIGCWFGCWIGCGG